MVVALLALFIALSGTAVAGGIVPLAKRALVADNAKKLGGQSLTQLSAAAQQLASAPGPASTAAGLITVKTGPFSLNASSSNDFAVACDSGQKAVSGGFDAGTSAVIPLDTRPSADGASWRLYLLNPSTSSGASGTLYAVCLK